VAELLKSEYYGENISQDAFFEKGKSGVSRETFPYLLMETLFGVSVHG